MTEKFIEFVRNVKLVRLILTVLENRDGVVMYERIPGSEKGYRYPLAEEYLGAEAEADLEQLADKGMLEREADAKELGCPRCGSIDLALRMHCPNCDSTNIEKAEVLEHLACGFHGPQAKFQDDTCPKCHQPIGQLGVDYVRQGLNYTCGACEELFQTPVQKLSCARENISFNVADAVEKRLYNYRITEKLKDEINKAVDQQKYIEEKITAFGFKAKSPAVLKGRSGITHQFFLVAAAGFGFVKTRIPIEILSDHEIGTEPVFGLYAKSVDVGAYGVLFAAIPKLSDDAKKVAESYGMVYVEADNLAMAAERLVGKFGELVETPEEQTLEIFGGLGGSKPAA
jgi:hypothetical protein